MHRSTPRRAIPGNPGRPVVRMVLAAVAVLGIVFATLLATAGVHHHEGGSFDQHCLICQVATTYAGGAPAPGIPVQVDLTASTGGVTEQILLSAPAPRSRPLHPRAPPVA